MKLQSVKSNEFLVHYDGYLKRPEGDIPWTNIGHTETRINSARKLGIVSPSNNKYGGRGAKISGAVNMVYVC